MPESNLRPIVSAFESRTQLVNTDRLVHAMAARGLDGIVATTANNVFYLSGFNGIAHKSDEPRPYAVVLSRHAPNEPILILADYYVGSVITNPTWIADVRSFRAVMLPMDLAPSPSDIERFIPASAMPSADSDSWVGRLCASYANNLGEACNKALSDLGLERGKVGFDDLRVGLSLDQNQMTVADAYDALMYARAVKTAPEIALLKQATALNEAATKRAIEKWDRGMSWRDFNNAYHVSAVELGGFVRDPGAMVWGHPRGEDKAITLQTSRDDFELEPGFHVLFDCHGTANMYCWDGGKTWIVDGDAQGETCSIANAVAAVGEEVSNAMRPGVRVSELQALGRSVFRKQGVPDANSALIFFHGLGLSHMDLEQTTADGHANSDWALEAGMVVPLHILYPGGDRQRIWLEEVVEVGEGGGTPYFSWGFDPIIAL